MENPSARLLSVNVSRPKEVLYRGRRIRTGIFKQPVEGRVALRRENLDGDAQADLRVHGGPDKAVYLYTGENTRYWEAQLGRELPFGQFGENFSVEGMPEDRVHIGDIFRIGGASIEVSEPRAPCFKLGLKMGSPQFLKPFLESGRTGFYARVLEVGEVGAGDAITLVAADPRGIAVREMTRLLYARNAYPETTEKALRIRSLSAGLRLALQERFLSDSVTA